MNEFFTEIANSLDRFPKILIVPLASFCGSLASCIVMAIAGGPGNDSPGKIVGQFIVGWLAGAFCGPAIVQPFVTFPPYTVSFVSGASGYWGIKVYLKKKQDDMLNKPPGA